jgi:hypothetical protein
MRCGLKLATLSAVLGCASAAVAQSSGYHVASAIPLPDGGFLAQATFDPTLRRVYIARADEVTAIDVDTGRVTAKLLPANRGHIALPLQGGAEILVTNGGANTADIYNARTGAPLASIKTGKKPDAAMFDAVTGLAVVMNANSGTLTLIDPKTRKAVGEIFVGGSLELAAPDGRGGIFVNVEDKNEVVVVDLKARKVLAHLALKGCDRPSGVGYLPRSRRVLSSCHNGVVTVTDPRSGKVEQTLPIGQAPDAVIYDARRHMAFIPTAGGELDLFADDRSGVHPRGKVKTRFGARTGALDEKTGRIYLPAADFDMPPPPGALPPLKPGSVVAVVVEP